VKELFAGEDFFSYYAVPLIARGKVQGVLEVFHRTASQPYPEWIEFLETLGGQTAIAIDNAMLFENLQKINVELEQSYDATIEGWSHALDLRDRETEGHTRRVTGMALGLARLMGIDEDKLIQMRRGGLLHDIGKLGVPDNILLKPGPLTDDEWEIMRMHPQFAYEWLSPINYLHEAVDIPYCHHEKWNGTGYPRGLRDESIPLASRIFAVADVWDALTSNRPYRQAWSQEEAIQYIRENSGIHFDPKVVDVFLKNVTTLVSQQ
jgi:HD-GYP domain-containing protein (c-di-GMP phosphodiesterase class II)